MENPEEVGSPAIVAESSQVRMGPFHIDAAGWLLEAQHIPSPNFDERPAGTGIELVVVHNISLPPSQFGGTGVMELFTNRLDPEAHPYYRNILQLRVSSHFFIRRSGLLVQFVPCIQRAWHAGVSTWNGRERCNDFSIGIELEGDDYSPFDEVQYKVLEQLLLALKATYPIAAIVGHSEIAPGRKTDPGPFFDWSRAGR